MRINLQRYLLILHHSQLHHNTHPSYNFNFSTSTCLFRYKKIEKSNPDATLGEGAYGKNKNKNNTILCSLLVHFTLCCSSLCPLHSTVTSLSSLSYILYHSHTHAHTLSPLYITVPLSLSLFLSATNILSHTHSHTHSRETFTNFTMFPAML